MGLSWRAELGGCEEPGIALLEWKMILGTDSSLHILQTSMGSAAEGMFPNPVGFFIILFLILEPDS